MGWLRYHLLRTVTSLMLLSGFLLLWDIHTYCRVQGLRAEIQGEEQLLESMRHSHVTKLKQKAFNLLLARRIERETVEACPNTTFRQRNFEDIYQAIVSAQKWERFYKQQYPEYASFYRWRGTLQVAWIESTMTKDLPYGHDSELGMWQILEYDRYRTRWGTINPKRTQHLYPLLCSLGYKRGSYGATIRAYRGNVDEQCHAFYEDFTKKLKEQGHTSFPAALVAYNAFQLHPLSSGYWLRYIHARSKFDHMIADVDQTLKGM